ncbi:MAG TPA: 2-amino-4-hydroxy-6-hydroxymethyldihydropteridine diphosphokinase [Mycobacteriales bacterium]|jgi:2-amino-4-hydroxy-6-hydroxymethyldihydropteridine diphosphokinase
MSRAVLSVGSNVGDRLAHLQSAVDALRDVLVVVSPVYQTAPWGGVEQDDFLNAVLLVDEEDTDEDEWLRRAQRLEHAAGRTREVRWGPRKLDVDIIAVDSVSRDDAALILPHPRAHLRAFVLVPWLDVEPQAVLAGHGPVRDLVGGVDSTGVRRRDDLELS